MSRLTALLATTSVVLGLATVAAPAAGAATDVSYTLPMSSFTDLVVDAAHDHVYLTSGADTVVVRNLAGAAVATVTGQNGANGIALSPDGTRLYAALRGANAISAIDTTTLTEVARYDTGASTCPLSLSAAGTAIWFSYGCMGGNGDIGLVDLSGEAPVVTLKKLPTTGYSTLSSLPHVAVTPDGTRMVAGVLGMSPSYIYSLTITDGTLAIGAERDLRGSLKDFQITPDGAHVVVADVGPTYSRLAVADLSVATTYASSAYGVAVAATDAYVAGGAMDSYGPDVRIYKTAGEQIRSYDFGSRTPYERGIALAPDASSVYVVSHPDTWPYGTSVVLHVLRDPTRYPTTITLTKPSSAKVNTAYTVTGTLSRAGAGATIHVKRTSKFGIKVMPDVVTGTNGTFSFSDNVNRRGSFTYTATYDGGGENAGTSRAVTFHVTGLVPSLTVTTNAATYAYNGVATVTARLGPTLNGRTVALAALPYLAPTQYLKNGAVDSGGYIRAQVRVTRRTTFRATFPGDDLYEPRVVTVVRTVHAWLGQTLYGHYGTSGAYRLYRRTVDPVLRTTVMPGHVGTCMVFEAQRYVSGAWRAVATNSCIRLENNSTAEGVLSGTPTVGVPYRVRSTFTGDHSNLRTVGPWLSLKFTY